jgi:hypothetical protein
MTAKTSQKLADTLRAAGFEELAVRAEHDEFHDFLSQHDLPSMALDLALMTLLKRDLTKQAISTLTRILERHHNGEFDADLAESEAWAKSEEGQATFENLVKGR